MLAVTFCSLFLNKRRKRNLRRKELERLLGADSRKYKNGIKNIKTEVDKYRAKCKAEYDKKVK